MKRCSFGNECTKTNRCCNIRETFLSWTKIAFNRFTDALYVRPLYGQWSSIFLKRKEVLLHLKNKFWSLIVSSNMPPYTMIQRKSQEMFVNFNEQL